MKFENLYPCRFVLYPLFRFNLNKSHSSIKYRKKNFYAIDLLIVDDIKYNRKYKLYLNK